jgi:hypothetical protein
MIDRTAFEITPDCEESQIKELTEGFDSWVSELRLLLGSPLPDSVTGKSSKVERRVFADSIHHVQTATPIPAEHVRS